MTINVTVEQAREIGAISRSYGLTLSDNRFPKRSPQFAAWLEGFRAVDGQMEGRHPAVVQDWDIL